MRMTRSAAMAERAAIAGEFLCGEESGNRWSEHCVNGMGHTTYPQNGLALGFWQ